MYLFFFINVDLFRIGFDSFCFASFKLPGNDNESLMELVAFVEGRCTCLPVILTLNHNKGTKN